MRTTSECRELDEVRKVLATSGFAELGGESGGLLLRSEADGALIAWCPAGIVRVQTSVHGHEDGHEQKRLTSLPGLHQAAGAAMPAVLEGKGRPAQ
ncbi:hypothetical protein [Streptomyces sp. NPDC048269]|uniref:hypothetical protein n=1 Tax=Streptomyces sp. NPDC048269 TaxID=3155753 RepID=UPI00342C0FA8